MEHLSCQVIRTKEELYELCDAWRELMDHSESSSIFLTWEWIASWVESVYPGVKLFVVLVKNGHGAIVAIAPFYIEIFTLFTIFKYKTLRFAGDFHTGMEYPDILVRKGYNPAALEQISRQLAEHKQEWDCAWLPNVASWSGALDRLSACFEKTNLSFCRRRNMEFSSIPLPGSYEEFLQRFSSKQRRNFRSRERRIFEQRDVAIRMCQSQTDLEEFLATLFRLHEKRWQHAGRTGAFVRRPLMVEFYKKMAACALEKGWLGFFILRVNGEDIAAQYGYIHNKTFSSLQEGFSPEGPSGCGNILRLHVIRWCIQNGCEEYDFLGGYSEHKKNWLAEKRRGYSLFLGRTYYKNIFFKLLPIWPSGRYINQGGPVFHRSH